MPEFETETRLAAPPGRCFALALSVDAHTASMSRSGERAVGGVTAGRMGPGDEVTWAARHFGVPFRMTSRITAHDEPHRFVDEQVSGPFAAWWHEHRFAADGEGTLMTDRIRYRLPLGPLGALAGRAGVDAYLRRLIVQRNAWLRSTLGGSA